MRRKIVDAEARRMAADGADAPAIAKVFQCDRHAVYAWAKSAGVNVWSSKTPHTIEECRDFAALCTNRTEFFTLHRRAYVTCRKRGWLDEVCSHMRLQIMPNGWWTKARCALEAAEHRTRGVFSKMAPSAYTQAHRNGWLDDICVHMRRAVGSGERWIYAVSSEEKNVAYIGLTWNPAQRQRGHRRSTNVLLRELVNGSHKFEIISGPHEQEAAAEIERVSVDKWKNDGWDMLNKAKPGALGGMTRRKWSKQRCLDAAKTCVTKADFRDNFPVAYAACWERGWLDEVYGSLKSADRHPNGYWTKERCAEAAGKCSSHKEFRRRFDVARQIAQRNGWMNEISAHMVRRRRHSAQADHTPSPQQMDMFG